MFFCLYLLFVDIVHYKFSSTKFFSSKWSETMSDGQETEGPSAPKIIGGHFSTLLSFFQSSLYAKIWLIYTALYWTFIVWIPILASFSFDGHLSSFILWCLGFIAIVCCAYSIWNGHFPSNNDNKTQMSTIGQYTTACPSSNGCIGYTDGFAIGFYDYYWQSIHMYEIHVVVFFDIIYKIIIWLSIFC